MPRGVNPHPSLACVCTPSGPPQLRRHRAGARLSPQSAFETTLKPSKLPLKMEAGHEGVAQRPKVSATLRVPVPSTVPGTPLNPH